MPEIDVFLMFDPSQRHSWTPTKNGKPIGKKQILKGPDWASIKKIAAKKGYTINIHGPSSYPAIETIQLSAKNAEVTLLVGHGTGTDDQTNDQKFVTNIVKLSDGIIHDSRGLVRGTWKDKIFDAENNEGKLKINKVFGVFTCNSSDEMRAAFEVPEKSYLITNDGGPDGLTRAGTLELGAAEFVEVYVTRNGMVRPALDAAKKVFKKIGEKYPQDRGDALSDGSE